MNIRSMASRAAIAGLLSILAVTASGQRTYPTRAVRLILPYAPGGSTSVTGRLLGQKLTEGWGQQVIVDNRPGGNTIIGSEALVRSPPDGHTIMMVTSTHTINPSILKTPYDAVKDFAPVTTITRSPFMLVVHPSLPVKNLREFISFAKARPGQIDYASSGTGTSNHLAVELLCMHAGIKLTHIPYKGGGPALVDLLGGQVQLHMNVPPNLIPNIKIARLRGIAVTGEARLVALPEVPTFREAGLPEFDLTNWQGILAPAGTPKPTIDKLAAEINKALQTPAMRDKLQSLGMNAWTMRPDEFAALIRSNIDTFAKVVKAAKVKAE
jgi:tripartite-type tricarboxylate transporter receptor subunit TctC